jgi:hypothetical protein
MVEVFEVEGVVGVEIVDEEFLEPVVFDKVDFQSVPVVDPAADEHLSKHVFVFEGLALHRVVHGPGEHFDLSHQTSYSLFPIRTRRHN